MLPSGPAQTKVFGKREARVPNREVDGDQQSRQPHDSRERDRQRRGGGLGQSQTKRLEIIERTIETGEEIDDRQQLADEKGDDDEHAPQRRSPEAKRPRQMLRRNDLLRRVAGIERIHDGGFGTVGQGRARSSRSRISAGSRSTAPYMLG